MRMGRRLYEARFSKTLNVIFFLTREGNLLFLFVDFDSLQIKLWR